MTKTYSADGSIKIAVEANNVDEARHEIDKIIAEIRNRLPTGATISIGEHHAFRKTFVKGG